MIDTARRRSSNMPVLRSFTGSTCTLQTSCWMFQTLAVTMSTTADLHTVILSLSHSDSHHHILKIASQIYTLTRARLAASASHQRERLSSHQPPQQPAAVSPQRLQTMYTILTARKPVEDPDVTMAPSSLHKAVDGESQPWPSNVLRMSSTCSTMR